MQNTSDFADLFAKELQAIRKKFSNIADQSASETTKINSSQETESFLLSFDTKSCKKLTRDQFRKACLFRGKVKLQGDYSTKVVVPSGEGDEPFVGYTPVNLVALCFSGGGIRSSTFNLGVLQGLSEIGLVPEFDYLSTVSGGGYVGSWWTAWRHRNKPMDPKSERLPVTGKNQPEPEEISWLRQRGNFLSPSTGVWHGELWRGLFLFLLGLSMTLIASVSLLALVSVPFMFIANLFGKSFLTLSIPAVLLIIAIAIAFIAMCSSQAARPSLERLATWFWGTTLCTMLMALATWISLEWSPILSFLTSSAATATVGAIFFKFGGVLSRRDLNERPSAIRLSLGRLVPRALALIGVGGLAIIASTVTRVTFSWFGDSLWHHTGVTVGLVVLAAVSSTLAANFPTLHAFYRSRITRTFLSAPGKVGETDASDFELSSLGNGIDPERPIHVINCCCNEADGMVLKRRGRNGISATVSPFGCCVGNTSTTQNKITLATIEQTARE
jgi:Patatin-like phospholipase